MVLSGGQSKKISISSIYANNSRIVILDEPSSDLAPIAEYELNCNIKDFEADKTMIFISRHPSTTRYVDKIYIFEDRRITESRPHDE